jgi:hypothetical protein
MEPGVVSMASFFFHPCEFRYGISLSQYGQTGLCSTCFGFSTLTPLLRKSLKKHRSAFRLAKSSWDSQADSTRLE